MEAMCKMGKWLKVREKTQIGVMTVVPARPPLGNPDIRSHFFNGKADSLFHVKLIMKLVQDLVFKMVCSHDSGT